ncbi:hypothetical protein E3N88_42824 [Mikania micrantha]|uniref:Ubiquitin-like protease family profile domain-containing protein n=1 Tax=Mikania micrantha TaxID=192012 RepID=A0A5N6LGL8_9ASTR|nr:hypothetical protein E3N88_42824 [Mikania micrantha]
MDNQRNKEIVNDEYSSQPVKKTSSWVFQKWRRASKNVGSSTSAEEQQPPEQMAYAHADQPESYIPNRRSVHQQRVGKWAILDDESKNWSNDAKEFFVNGDAPFCYSGVFNTPLQLDRCFWGTLLGYACNRYLTPEHIEGWVGRMMQWRHRQQQTAGGSQMRWSILPPRFFDYLVDSNTKNTVNFANGKLSPYPSFFDVDYVYFPFCVENHEWLLVQIDLRTIELTMYCSEIFTNEKYRRAVHPKLMKISVYFGALLVNIKYFKKTRAPEKLLSFEVNEDHVQSHNELIGNQGVHVCMLMEHLVTGKPLNVTGNFKNWCVAYRRYMADQIYFWRCLPRPSDV